MLKLLSRTIASLSLVMSASLSEPAWSASKDRAHKAKCPYAHKQPARAARLAATQPDRGMTIIEKRKLDVQILSFGP